MARFERKTRPPRFVVKPNGAVFESRGWPGMRAVEVQAIADEAAASRVASESSASSSAQSATAAEVAATRAENAEAAKLEIPDTNVSALIGNGTTATRIALDTNTLGLAQRTDYVDIGRRFSPYRTMEVRKASNPYSTDPVLEVSCVADDGRHVTYVIANSSPGGYLTVADIWEGATTQVFLPEPTTDITVDNGAYDYRAVESVRSGTFDTAGTYYTTQVGAYFEGPADFQLTSGQLKVSLRTYTDNRGGVWRLSIVGHPELGTKDFSTWAASPALKMHTDVWTLSGVPAGAYRVRATFQGADPSNAPTGGTARGWTGTGTDAAYLMRVSTLTPRRDKSNALKFGYSNPDYAVSIRPAVGGTYRYVPWHNQGEAVESQTAPSAFYDGTTPLDVAGMAIGDRIALTHSFEIVQRIRGRNVTAGPDLISVATKQRITPDGVHSVEGAIKTLADIQVSSSSYVLMHIVNPQIFDRLVSSWGNEYGIDVAGHPNATVTVIGVEGNKATSWASVSAAQPDLFSALRFNDPSAALHVGQATLADPLWIEHRNNTLAKLYPRIGYPSDTVVPAGTVWRFSGDYWYGRLPGIAHTIAP